MQTRRAARVAAEEDEAALESASAHAVLFSQDLWRQHLWRLLDPESKAALRLVSKGMRSQVDAAVEVVASPSHGASANQLRSALLRWPAVRELTLLNVRDAAALAPLSMASLAGLTSLTVRQVGMDRHAWLHGAHPHARMARAPSLSPAPSHAHGLHGLPCAWARTHACAGGTSSLDHACPGVLHVWHERMSQAPSLTPPRCIATSTSGSGEITL
jgi:hypothetical protein